MRRGLLIGVAIALLGTAGAGLAKGGAGGGGEDGGGEDEAPLYPVAVDGEYGFIDATGAVVVAPQFAAVQPFFEGRAAVQIGELWGFVDGQGTPVIKPAYEQVAAFSEGLAAVRSGGKVGFVDGQGTLVIPATLDGADNFVDGRALHSLPTDEADPDAAPRYGYLGPDGAPAFEASFAAAAPFSDGRAAVSSDGEAFGYIDPSGALVIAEQYADAHPFSEGLATVRTADGAWQVIDAQGAMVFAPDGFVGSFADGRAGLQVGELYGFVDAAGAVIVEPRFGQVGTFAGGLAPVLMPEGQVAFVVPQGEPAFEARFDDTIGFVGPLALVRDGLTWGYVDRAGAWVWRPPAPAIPDEASAAMAALVGQEVAGASYPFLVDGAVSLTELVGVYPTQAKALAAARVHAGWEVIVAKEVGGTRYLGVYASPADYLLRELTFEFREGFDEMWIVEFDTTAEQAFATAHDAVAACRQTDAAIVEFLAANPDRELDVPRLRHLATAVGGGVQSETTMLHLVK